MIHQRSLVTKRLHAMKHFTKVRIFLISQKGFLFQRKLAKHGEQNVQN